MTGRGELRLVSELRGYRCEFQLEGEAYSFEAVEASEAYASALLHLLEMHRAPSDGN
ncbi:MAG TPA: hypothetical protein VF498_19070 [Anaerolineales bacterium]